MNKHSVHTTVSSRHWELLKKQMEKYGSQQKVLELALESLENNQKPVIALTGEEELWMRIGRELRSAFLLVQNDAGKLFMQAADPEQFREYVANLKPAEFALEWYYRKPLKDCSIRELVDGVILIFKMEGGIESIGYTDEGDHYKINITHSMGLKVSKLHTMMYESLFKSYGVKAESHYSERGVIFKIFK